SAADARLPSPLSSSFVYHVALESTRQLNGRAGRRQRRATRALPPPTHPARILQSPRCLKATTDALSALLRLSTSSRRRRRGPTTHALATLSRLNSSRRRRRAFRCRCRPPGRRP
ncbi:unnamed protein product, partial [Ectocarpus sp. 12 AP-2014]